MSRSSTARIRTALLIVNPAARRAAPRLAQATGALAAAGVRIDVHTTDAAGHAAAIARAAAGGHDAVFTLGGDGTAIEVIGALAGAGPPVGVLPGGTANVVARALGVPGSVADAVRALVGGRESRMDLGRFGGGRYFAIGLGVGVDEAMIATVSPWLKRRAGVLAYFASGTRAGLRLERFRYRLTVDGRVMEGDAVSILIANLGAILGGFVTLGADIRPDDGVLDVCVFAPHSVVEAVRVFGRMIAGTVGADPRVSYVRGRSIRLETDPTRGAQSDGELVDGTPLEVTVAAGAARLLTPAR